MENKGETFKLTYSASEQEEIKRIREKYAPPEQKEDKMAKLRRLDGSATRAAMITSLTVGIVGTLLLGVGMCCTMLSEWAETMFVFGIIIGIIGIIGIAGAYPIYVKMVKKKRAKLAPEILRLTEELMK